MGRPLKEVELSASEEPGAEASKEREGDEAPLLVLGQEEDNGHGEIQRVVKNSDVKESVIIDGRKRERDDASFPVERFEALDGLADGGEDTAPLLSKRRTGDVEFREMPSSSDTDGGKESRKNENLVSSDSLEEMEVKYAAYLRHDMYGNWGTRTVSLWEKAKLFLALVTLCPIRVCLLFSILVLFYLICKVCTLRVIAASDEEEGEKSFSHLTGARRSIIVRSGRFLSRSMLFVLGFYHIPVFYRTADRMNHLHLGLGDPAGRDNVEATEDMLRPGAIVSNHISYLDILYQMSASFPSFVAKGWSMNGYKQRTMTQLLQRFFYFQGDFFSFMLSNFLVSSTLGFYCIRHVWESPCLVEKGTTTNGDYLLPFKTGAFLARTPVKPVILKYLYKRFSPAWDTISGPRHLVLLLCQFVNYLEVVHLPVYCPTDKECSDPKLYANNVRTLMAAEGNLTMSDIGLYEKRIFHAALLGTRFPIAPAPQDMTGTGSDSK